MVGPGDEGPAARTHEGPELRPGESRESPLLVVTQLPHEGGAAVGHRDHATAVIDDPQVGHPTEAWKGGADDQAPSVA